MTEDRDQWADKLFAEHIGGWLTSFFAEEERFDRRTKLRLASWGAGAVGAVALAILASQSSAQLRREQMASADLLAQQAAQLQSVARDTQTDSRRLAAAIDTLNSDRDRLFSRVTSVEQGLNSVTGAIKRQAATVAAPSPSEASALSIAQAAGNSQAPQAATPPPLIGPVATAIPAPVAPTKPGAITPPQAAERPAVAPVLVVAEQAAKFPPAITPTLMPAPLMAEKSIMAQPDSAATPLSEPARETAEKSETADKPETVIAAVQPSETSPAPPELPAIPVQPVPVQRTEFGIDLGGANTLDGLRALWRGTVASNKSLSGLRPIILLRERPNAQGIQLRLVAGPFSDAAAAARLCATLGPADRPCETTVFEGQRLAMKSETAAKSDTVVKRDITATPLPPPAAVRPARRKRGTPQVEQRSEEPPAKPEEPAPKPQSSQTSQTSLSSFLGIR